MSDYTYSLVSKGDDDDNHSSPEIHPMEIEIEDGSAKKKTYTSSRRANRTALPLPSNNPSKYGKNEDLVQQRMPICLGLVVLLAIVYVLSRTSSQSSSLSLPLLPSSSSKYPPHHSSPSPPSHYTSPSSLSAVGEIDYSNLDYSKIDMGKLRNAAFARTPPHLIECALASSGGPQSACHLPPQTRFAAVKQKGATLWMTGCSGSGKTTIATALEDKLVKLYGKHVYRLDGDNIRTGLNRDLSFSEADRAESVRRVGEMSTLFSDAGVITLVGLISPYREDRDMVRKRHEDQNIPFYEVFLDVPVSELKKRDPKGQYAKVESGELKHFTCIDDPYENPLKPEITLKTHEVGISESVDILFERLRVDGILDGPPKLNAPGLPNPDGDFIVDLLVPKSERSAKRLEAETLPKVLITDVELNWLQVIGEGWASPLRGFMREGTLLETLHFNSIGVDPFNLTGNAGIQERITDFNTFKEKQPPLRVSMSVPITLSITEYSKMLIEKSGKSACALVTQMGQTVAILRDPEIYENRKEEIISRMYGVIDPGHPYIKLITAGGPYLLGGEVELLGRIRYNDGLDVWRKTAKELMAEFESKGADVVYAFQTRNPTHAGHAYLMKSAGDDLKTKGFKRPVLWLSPLGGWTKFDDVPLDVRVHQHEEVLNNPTHPGGLDPGSTVMAIWPAPMVYAGPTEVQFHAKSRRSAGASYFVVGRDPAGMKGSLEAVSHYDDDLYNGNHGRYVLQMSPGIGDMKILAFVKVMYDTVKNSMTVPDLSRISDFISISGTMMRKLASQHAKACPNKVPTDLLEANCVPNNFMVPKGWDVVTDYYSNVDEKQWVSWSRPLVVPFTDESNTENVGQFGSKEFKLKLKSGDSFWHSIDTYYDEDKNIVNMVTEIPMFVTAKMEVNKSKRGNPISQDSNSDGTPRYYTYGTPRFNYGLIPQTWEDPRLKDEKGKGGDNDPLDVMEVGGMPLRMGSVTPCKVLGSLEMIDGGETDHKIICVSKESEHYSKITDFASLEEHFPGTISTLVHWLKFYKTSDGKAVNVVENNELPLTVNAAMKIIEETRKGWRKLCQNKDDYEDFDLSGCP